MSYSTILFDSRDGITRITINRPDRLNALTAEAFIELRDALDRAAADRNTRVVLITGTGRGFCAGQDLTERKRGPDDPPRDLGASIIEKVNPLVRIIAQLKAPVVCAVNGVAAGAGANLALACDIVIARNSARFVQSFSKVGLISDAGGTWHLPRLAGQARALGMMLTGEPIDAPTAAAWGLIWRAVPDDDFDREVELLLSKLAAAPTMALAATKSAVRNPRESLDAQLALEAELQRQMGLSADYREGVNAFLEKRPAQFGNH
jgi:2-(1,2-epoxy-1,2-dihydrophenyl)acetyl-CoA isomerase